MCRVNAARACSSSLASLVRLSSTPTLWGLLCGLIRRAFTPQLSREILPRARLYFVMLALCSDML